MYVCLSFSPDTRSLFLWRMNAPENLKWWLEVLGRPHQHTKTVFQVLEPILFWHPNVAEGDYRNGFFRLKRDVCKQSGNINTRSQLTFGNIISVFNIMQLECRHEIRILAQNIGCYITWYLNFLITDINLQNTHWVRFVFSIRHVYWSCNISRNT